jgi:MOSC domain-containing protein YiiM
MEPRILGLFVNPNGGVPKHPVETLVVTNTGCIGDRQNDLKHHGGPTRAVCLLLDSVLTRLISEGHPIGPGSTGENILIQGLEPSSFSTGVILDFGTVTLQITGPAPPCKTIKASFLNEGFTALSHKLDSSQTRWYASVLKAGKVETGQSVSIFNESEQVGSR